jgi:hypothetical protein
VHRRGERGLPTSSARPGRSSRSSGWTPSGIPNNRSAPRCAGGRGRSRPRPTHERGTDRTRRSSPPSRCVARSSHRRSAHTSRCPASCDPRDRLLGPHTRSSRTRPRPGENPFGGRARRESVRDSSQGMRIGSVLPLCAWYGIAMP